MPEPVAILMVDDDRNVSVLTREFLQSKGYRATLLHNAQDAIKAVQSENYALCILDIEMPLKDGFTLAQEIREIKPEIPVIFLTAKTSVEDRVRGLQLGAEDYITKPYSLEELNLRIQNIIRRSQRPHVKDHESFAIGPWSFSPTTQQLQGADTQLNLTTIESQLLRMLCLRAGNVLKRDDALREIWSDEYGIKENNLKVYISKLRKHFQDLPGVEILNVHGVGYRLVSDG